MKKLDITADVVTCLLREQFPDLAHLPVTPMDVDGWDNSSFRIGAEHTARLPSGDGYVPAVAKEHRWLPVLSPQLPVPIPEPVALGAPGCGFPRPWSVYRWLPGDTASSGHVTDLGIFARDVAQFLTALWAVDPTGGPAAGAHSSGRGGPLSLYGADVHACLGALPAQLIHNRVLDTWAAALSSPFEAEPCWFHGDIGSPRGSRVPWHQAWDVGWSTEKAFRPTRVGNRHGRHRPPAGLDSRPTPSGRSAWQDNAAGT